MHKTNILHIVLHPYWVIMSVNNISDHNHWSSLSFQVKKCYFSLGSVCCREQVDGGNIRVSPAVNPIRGKILQGIHLYCICSTRFPAEDRPWQNKYSQFLNNWQGNSWILVLDSAMCDFYTYPGQTFLIGSHVLTCKCAPEEQQPDCSCGAKNTL